MFTRASCWVTIHAPPQDGVAPRRTLGVVCTRRGKKLQLAFAALGSAALAEILAALDTTRRPDGTGVCWLQPLAGPAEWPRRTELWLRVSERLAHVSQHQLGQLRRALIAYRRLARKAAADVHQRRRQLEHSRGVRHPVAAGREHWPDDRQANLPAVVVPGQQQVEIVPARPADLIGGVRQEDAQPLAPALSPRGRGSGREPGKFVPRQQNRAAVDLGDDRSAAEV